jgi:hypothetical protein
MMITPMLAASGPLPADSAKWAYEVKWDGFRALLQASPAGVTITSRNGYDMTSRYPELECLSHVRALSARTRDVLVPMPRYVLRLSDYPHHQLAVSTLGPDSVAMPVFGTG